MKQCPVCKSTFTDATLRFCLSDGASLIDLGAGAATHSSPTTQETVVMPGHAPQTGQASPRETTPYQKDQPAKSKTGLILKIGVVVVVLGILGVLVVGAGAFFYFRSHRSEKIAASNTTSLNSPPQTTSSSTSAEKAKPSSAQQAIIDSGTEVKWDDQGISWKLPAGWRKMDVKKEQFNYQSPDNAFLLVNISVMSDDFPMDISMKAYYDQAMQQLKNGKYESVRMLDIDGIQGVEFTEAAPEEKDGIRRHQWIAYRTYLGQKQQLNVMTSTRQSNFAKHTDDFAAILYSMKVIK